MSVGLRAMILQGKAQTTVIPVGIARICNAALQDQCRRTTDI
jgi:hypothetical protein